MAVVAVVISALALVLGVVNAVMGLRQRSREADAAVTADLYPVLRTIRDAAWQYAKPLGGGGDEHLVTLHYALNDLADLRPAIRNRELERSVGEVLVHPAAALPLSIDPPRFMGAFMGDDGAAEMHALATLVNDVVEACQRLRRGVR